MDGRSLNDDVATVNETVFQIYNAQSHVDGDDNSVNRFYNMKGGQSREIPAPFCYQHVTPPRGLRNRICFGS